MAVEKGFTYRQSSSNFGECSPCAMKEQMLRLLLEEKEDLRITIKSLEERNRALEQEVKKLKGLKAQEKSSVPPVTVDTSDTDCTLRSAMHAPDPGEPGNHDGSGKSSRYVTESAETGHSFIPSGATQPTSKAIIVGQASDGSYAILDQIDIEQARDVAIASNGDLFVSSRHDHCVYVYTEDTQGKMVRKTKIGSEGSGKLQFNEPHGMAIYGSIVYLTEYEGNRVHVFQIINSNAGSISPKYVDMLSQWSGGSDRLYNPHDVKLDSEGLVYVADRSNDRVLVFRHNINSKEWTMLHEFDVLSTGNAQPEGIAFDTKGYVHITNYSGSLQSITVFTKQAELSRIYYKGDNKMKGIIPKGIAINSAGRILVTAIECPGTEDEEGHLMVFDEDGNRLHHISGVFTNPFGIWIMKGNESVIWVADMVLDKVLKLELSCLK